MVEVAWTLARVIVEEPTSRVPSNASGSVESADALVPPFPIPRTPVMSVVKETREEEMTPAVLFKTPVMSAPKVMVLFAMRFEVEAVVAMSVPAVMAVLDA